MKKIAFVVLCAGWFFSSNATDARVLTMGGNDNFFMDDISIYRNPANINYYPNMLLALSESMFRVRAIPANTRHYSVTIQIPSVRSGHHLIVFSQSILRVGQSVSASFGGIGA